MNKSDTTDKSFSKEEYETALQFALYLILHILENKSQTIEYNELAKKLNRNQRALGKYLGILVRACHKLQLPPISSIVLYKDKDCSGTAFYLLAGELGYSGDALLPEVVFQEKQWWKLIRYLEEQALALA